MTHVFGERPRDVGAQALGRVHVVCLLVVASQLVPGEPLIVGANRDEVLDRPATSITVLDVGPPRVLGGRDELSGGTWLAVNEHGLCAGLTNQPLGEAKDPSEAVTRRAAPRPRPPPERPHRRGRISRRAYRPADYNGAWLLVGDRTSLFFVDFTGTTGATRGGTAARRPHTREPRPRGALAARSTWCERRSAHPSTATPWSPPSGASWRTTASPRMTSAPTWRAVSTSRGSGHAPRASCAVRDGSGLPQLEVADGPPCATPYQDAGELWGRSAAAPPTQSRTSGL